MAVTAKFLFASTSSIALNTILVILLFLYFPLSLSTKPATTQVHELRPSDIDIGRATPSIDERRQADGRQ